MDHRFITSFVVVSGLLAAAVYSAGRAATHGGLVLIGIAVLTGVIGLLGFIVLARVVVTVERSRAR